MIGTISAIMCCATQPIADRYIKTGALTLYIDFGDNSGEYADDDTCDDNRFTGDGRSILTTDSHVKRDSADCIAAYQAGRLNRP